MSFIFLGNKPMAVGLGWIAKWCNIKSAFVFTIYKRNYVDWLISFFPCLYVQLIGTLKSPYKHLSWCAFHCWWMAHVTILSNYLSLWNVVSVTQDVRAPVPRSVYSRASHMYIKYSKCTEYTVRQFILLNLIQVQLSIVTGNKIQTSEENLLKPQESKAHTSLWATSELSFWFSTPTGLPSMESDKTPPHPPKIMTLTLNGKHHLNKTHLKTLP